VQKEQTELWEKSVSTQMSQRDDTGIRKQIRVDSEVTQLGERSRSNALGHRIHTNGGDLVTLHPQLCELRH
jgi:hypothetical protein